MERADLDAAEVSRLEAVRLVADAGDDVPGEQVEAHFVCVHVRRDRAAGVELRHAQPGVHRAGRVIDEHGFGDARAVAGEGRIRFKGAERADVMHRPEKVSQ